MFRPWDPFRARVERLASAWPTSPETVFIHWIHPTGRCPACARDLVAHAQEAALAEAVEGRDPRELPPLLVFFWTEDLATCPRCGAALATTEAERRPGAQPPAFPRSVR